MLRLIEIGKTDSLQSITEFSSGSGSIVTTYQEKTVLVDDYENLKLKVTEESEGATLKYEITDTKAEPTTADESGFTQSLTNGTEADLTGISSSHNIIWIYAKAQSEEKTDFFKITVNQKEQTTQLTVKGSPDSVMCESGNMKATFEVQDSGAYTKEVKVEVKDEGGTGEATGVTDATYGAGKITVNFSEQVSVEKTYTFFLTETDKRKSEGTQVKFKPYEAPKSDVTTLSALTIGTKTPSSFSSSTLATDVSTATDMGTVELDSLTEVAISLTTTENVSKVEYKINKSASLSPWESGTDVGGSEKNYTGSISSITDKNYVFFQITAENGTTNGYFYVQVNKKEEVEKTTPSISTTSKIIAGEDNPTVELTATVGTFDETNSKETGNYTITKGDTGLETVSAANYEGGKVTLTLSGTAKPGTLKIQANAAAFSGGNNNNSNAVEIIIAEPTLTVSPSSITTSDANPKFTVTINNGKFAKSSSTVDGTVKAEGVAGLEYSEGATYKSETEIEVPMTGTATATGEISITIPADAIKGLEKELTVKVTVSTPSTGSSTPSTTVDKPVTDAESGETKVDVNTNSTTSGTTAKATVSSSNMDKAVDSAVTEAEKQGTAPVVEVEVKTSARADSLNVTLPAAALEKLAEAEDASLVVTSDIAGVALDNTALSALADQATGSTVTLEVAPVAASELNAAQAAAAGEAAVMDLSLVSNGVVIHDYNNGKITVTLPYKLAEGKDPASVQVYFLDDNGALTPCDTSYADGKVVFTTTHLSKYVIGDESMAPVAFDDVPAGIWYAGAVNYAVKNDLMTGIGGNLFAPDTTTTRAMMVTLLYNLEGKPAVDYAMTYADVPETWYTEAVRWATSEEIITGYSETAFGPEDTITREQMAVLLCQYAAYKGYDVTAAADLSGYSDADSVSSWAEGAMRWAVAEGLISGKTADILDPAGDASRAEIAVLLMNFCEKIAK